VDGLSLGVELLHIYVVQPQPLPREVGVSMMSLPRTEHPSQTASLADCTWSGRTARVSWNTSQDSYAKHERHCSIRETKMAAGGC
jgi:hypothetical protein